MSYASEQGVLNGQWNAAEMAFQAEANRVRPCVVWRPKLLSDGDQWCALFGENLQEGVAGFGDTPEAAMVAFDLAWLNDRTPTAMRIAKLAEARP